MYGQDGLQFTAMSLNRAYSGTCKVVVWCAFVRFTAGPARTILSFIAKDAMVDTVRNTLLDDAITCPVCGPFRTDCLVAVEQQSVAQDVLLVPRLLLPEINLFLG